MSLVLTIPGSYSNRAVPAIFSYLRILTPDFRQNQADRTSTIDPGLFTLTFLVVGQGAQDGIQNLIQVFTDILC